MPLRPGSFPWLVAHDLRQSARNFEALFRGMSRFRIGLVLVSAIVALHGLAWPAALWLGAIEAEPGGAGRIEAYAAAGALAILPWMIAQAMTGAMRSLYARGDFDLLFASPVSVFAVLGSRALAIAIEGAASGALLLLPLADMSAVFGRTKWLAIYPTLMACALFGAGLGLMLAMALFVGVGPRRARALSQVAATLIGASFIVSAQILSMLPTSIRDRLTKLVSDPSPGSLLDHHGPLWLPVRSALGDIPSLITWTAMGLAMFLAAVLVCGGRFAHAAALAAGSPSAPSRQTGSRAFRGGLGASMRMKERKLVWRDPWLLSQILLQILYTLPVSIVLWRNGGLTGSAGVAFAPSIVVISAQLSGSLAWVALSGEDAPDFLATAPVTRAEVDRRKIEAIALPIALILAIPILGLAIASPLGGLYSALFAIGAGFSTALINLWRQAPAQRGMVLRRHSQSKLVGLIEHLMSILWAVGCVLAIIGSWTALFPAGLAIFVVWLNRPRRAKRASQGKLATAALSSQP